MIQRRSPLMAERLFSFYFCSKTMKFLSKLRFRFVPWFKYRNFRDFAVNIPENVAIRLISHRHHNTHVSYMEVFDRVEMLMRRNELFLKQDLDAELLARLACTNRVYLSRAIQLCTGLSIRDYLGKYRVNYAMHLFMRNPNMRVRDLAYMCGFNSPNSFNNTFKRLVHVTPGQWCSDYRRSMHVE